jgi:integrase
MTVRFMQRRGNAWRYRRKVPAGLRERLGKGELVVPLGSSEAEALRRYPAAHAAAERLLADASRPRRKPLASTALDLHRDASGQLDRWGVDSEWSGWGEPDDAEGVTREVIAEGIASKYPLDDDGHPAGVTERDAATLRALMLGTRDLPPKATLEDAKREYLERKVKDNEKWRKQVDRIFGLVAEVVKLDTPLLYLRRRDARAIVEKLLADGRKPASAQRYLNTLRAALLIGVRELEVKGYEDPFDKLPVEERGNGAAHRNQARDAYTEAEVRAVEAHLAAHAGADLALIWQLVKGTGCRLAEITGLRRVDVRLDHGTPHLSVEWHEGRRIKTNASVRVVPLLGDALAAAREAVERAGDGVLFPAYCREGGADAASAALTKHFRKVVKRPKVTVAHSLRHRMGSLLDLAGVGDRERNLVMGHTRSEASEGYGGEADRLEVAKRILTAALAEVAKRP